MRKTIVKTTALILLIGFTAPAIAHEAHPEGAHENSTSETENDFQLLSDGYPSWTSTVVIAEIVLAAVLAFVSIRHYRRNSD